MIFPGSRFHPHPGHRGRENFPIPGSCRGGSCNRPSKLLLDWGRGTGVQVWPSRDPELFRVVGQQPEAAIDLHHVLDGADFRGHALQGRVHPFPDLEDLSVVSSQQKLPIQVNGGGHAVGKDRRGEDLDIPRRPIRADGRAVAGDVIVYRSCRPHPSIASKTRNPPQKRIFMVSCFRKNGPARRRPSCRPDPRPPS